MPIELAERTHRIQPSATLAVTAKAQELRAAGQNVIGLGSGEPDFDTPKHIKEAAIAAINAGFTKYTPVDGIPDLKEAIIAKFQRDNGLNYQNNQILVSCGGKQSFFNMALALLNPGDEAIIPAPYWVSYPDMVAITGAKPVVVLTNIDQRFKITPQQLDAAITPKTRLFVINSPSNPCGTAYTQAELHGLAEVLRRHPQVIIATDDMYEHILWAPEPFHNILMVAPDLYARTIVLNGVSKAYSMTGWRIGYAGGPAELIGAMKKVQSQSTSNPTSISQKAAVAAIAGDQNCIKPMVQAFQARHDFIVQALNDIEGVHCLPSDGAFYAFPSFAGVIERLDDVEDDVTLAQKLLTSAGVALVPGTAFGAKNFLRLSFATSTENLKQALVQIKAAVT